MKEPVNKKDDTNEQTISDMERVKILLFGTVRYRFSVLLITSGVFLIGETELWEIIIRAIAEFVGLEKVPENLESTDSFSQIMGTILIAIGVIHFLYPLYADWKLNRRTMKAQIIYKWAKEEKLEKHQLNWLQENSQWADKFWDLTRKTEISTRERIRSMRKIR